MTIAEAEQYDQFQTVFRTWYSALCNYALTFTRDTAVSEDIVQDLFVKIWEQRRGLLMETSIRYYLFTAVRNNCITWLRREKHQATIPFTDDQTTGLAADDPYPGEVYRGGSYTGAASSSNRSGYSSHPKDQGVPPRAAGEKDEMTLLQEGIDGLPPKCREVFLLSRFSKLSYKEIAASLDISPKTVENQLSKALRLLRAYLRANGVGLALILTLILS